MLEHIYKDPIMKYISSIILLLLLSDHLYCQSTYPIESGTHIFWQPNRKLVVDDFQGGNSTDSKFFRDRQIGRHVIPCLGIFLQIDIPKNYQKNKLEKVYFAPAFQKSCSFLLNGDTSNFRDAQLQFDIYELGTRIAREYIWNMHAYMAVKSDSNAIDIIKNNPDTILITGIGNIFASKARDSAKNFINEITYSYFNDQYIKSDSISTSYEKWRSLIDELLKKYERFATKPEDCYRMIKNTPILKNYKKSN